MLSEQKTKGAITPTRREKSNCKLSLHNVIRNVWAENGVVSGQCSPLKCSVNRKQKATITSDNHLLHEQFWVTNHIPLNNMIIE